MFIIHFSLRGILAEGPKFLMLSPELDPEKLTRMAEGHPGFLHDFSFYSLVDNQDARHRDIARASGLCNIRNMQKI